MLAESCAFFLVTYPSQDHEFQFLPTTVDRCTGWGGAPRHSPQHEDGREPVHKGIGHTVNARFTVMCAHYLCDPDFCNIATG